MGKFKILQIITLLALLSALGEAQQAMNSRMLDDQSPPDLESKCGNCPCDSPCVNPTPPPPPPPPKKPPPTNYCPPPPIGGQNPPNPPYIYINGPPGSVYPVYPYYSGGARRFSMGIIPFLISFVSWAVAF